MMLSNLRVTVSEITEDTVVVKTEQDNTISIPKHLLSDMSKGTQLFLAIDKKPLVSSEKQAKDILNEMIKG